MENNNVNFKEGKRIREELYVERLYYIAVDPLNKNSWINVLGEKAFIAWLQMQTLVDRSSEAVSKYNNLDTVPRSIQDLAKTLNMSRTTLYTKILKPLWNYGFIDFEEWKEQKKAGQKATNIVVYPYPQNNIELQYKPLTKVRDYDKEYSSNAKTYNNTENRKQRSEQMNLHLANSNYEAKWCHDILVGHLKDFGIKEKILLEIQYELSFYPTTLIPLKFMEEQLFYMQSRLEHNEPIYNFAKYFVGGIIIKADMEESMTGVKAKKEEIEQYKVEKLQSLRKVEFYNWLEERE